MIALNFSYSKKVFFTHARLITKLALSDICHEWRMSLCMILAVAAISTPLLLFFGLKNGTVETLRSRLLENPVNLELLPNTEKLLNSDWFEQMQSDPRVGFVVPHTRKLSAQVDVKALNSKGRTFRLDARPTGDGDLLLSRYLAPIPRADECVLTAKAAQSANIQQGNDVIFTVTRDQGRDRATHKFRVVGILPPQASPLPGVYITLEDLERIENFKDGRAVPEWKWAGTASTAHPEFSQILLLTAQPLDPLKRVFLVENTGFASLKEHELDDKDIEQYPGIGTMNTYILSTLGSMASENNIAAVKNKLRDIQHFILPLPRNYEIEIVQSGEKLKIAPATALNTSLPNFSLPESCTLEDWASLRTHPVPRHFIVSQKTADLLGASEINVRITASMGEISRAIEFPARFIANSSVDDGMAFAPLSLIGTINLLYQRNLGFELIDGENATKDFVLGRRGYSGFRMYASCLEDVAPLATTLESMGIKVVTRADRIAEVRSLDYYLSLLFWIIALASITGGIACLTANMYASVERKRRELAVLRLLGVHGLSLSFFPLVMVTSLCAGGLALGMVLFHSMATLINHLFSSHLEQGETFCRLSSADQGYALGAALLVALMAGTCACRRMAAIQPSESLRDE